MISILYVDDEPDLLDIGKLFLEQEPGFSVDITTSAQDAMKRMRIKRYDAILSDYHMPEMDGIQLLQAVRRQGDRIPFIIFTGRGREDVIIQALNSGVDFYLQKGGDPRSQFAELTHLVGKAVHQWRAEEELRVSAGKLQGIVHGSPIPQFVIDNDHRVISWNPALERYSGVKAEEVMGTNRQWRAFYLEARPCLADLIVDGTLEMIPDWYGDKCSRSKYVDGGYEASDFFLHMGPSGTWLHFTAAPIRDRNGTITGAVETLEDISEEKRAEETLRQINRKLNLMSSITRHDILNQLTALSGYISLVKPHLSDPKDLDYLSHCENAARNIDHHLAFTREYQDIGVISPLWQRTGDLVDMVSREISSGGTRIVNDLSVVEIYADPLLEKVFFNLVENALRHGGNVTCIRFQASEGVDGLVITCQDDGTGIPDSQKLKVFERGVGRHTGYGLFLAREILSITGITIRECGKEGAGARFEILVPRGAYRGTKP